MCIYEFRKKRMFMKFTLVSLLFVVTACSSSHKKEIPDINPMPGNVSMIQAATGATETYINILRGRWANYSYYVETKGQRTGMLRKYSEVVPGADYQWAVDKIHVSQLEPNIKYELVVYHNKFKTEIERREFYTLDLSKKKLKFVVGSCMSENHIFQHVIPEIWNLVNKQNPDLLLLIGDNVYVDEFDLVRRNQNVSARDIWQRYIDTIRNLPIYKQRKLVPILATWDDHDFGTNNSNKNFHKKEVAKKVFRAFYSSPNIKGVTEYFKNNISFQFMGFGQRFIFLDNRFYREKPGSSSKNGHFGKEQNKWAFDSLNQRDLPTWFVSGGQFFSSQFLLKNGRQVNETFMEDYKSNHQEFVSKLATSNSPVAFLSGDIHYTEIMKIGKDQLGYTSYEVTSSPMHSFIFRPKKKADEFFSNPKRLVAVKDYNFVVIESQVNSNKEWNIKVKAVGPKNPDGFFEKNYNIYR